MKILLVDTACDGHHLTYLNTIIEACISKSIDVSALLPQHVELNCRCFVFKHDISNRDLLSYYHFLRDIREIKNKLKIDIVHILNGDYLYRFFGIGIGLVCKNRGIITFHSVRRSRLHDFSLRHIFRNINLGIVHTIFLKSELDNLNIKNVETVYYPCFATKTKLSVEECRKKIGINENICVIGALGGTREDKGLDLLFDALERIDVPYCLVIVGPEMYFDKTYIEKRSKAIKGKVIYDLRFVTDEEMTISLKACDVLVFPYRKIFNGASGPMIDGIYYHKTILATNHGSLGRTVERYHVGKTFKSEDTIDLAKTIEETLKNDFIYDETAEEFVKTLDVHEFKNNYLHLYQRLK